MNRQGAGGSPDVGQESLPDRWLRAKSALAAAEDAAAGADPVSAAGRAPARSVRRTRPEVRRHGPPAEVESAPRVTPTAGQPDEEQAREIALRSLTNSARSRAQVAQTLARKQVPPEIAATVLDRFEQVGLLNDTEYAQTLVRTRVAERGLARRALAAELRRKGIAEEIAQQALAHVDPEDESESATALVRKRLRTMGSLDDDVKRRRLLAMLARKGHSPGLSYRVIDAELRLT